jgi:hypothetical protein
MYAFYLTRGAHEMLSFGESSIRLAKFNSLDEFVKASSLPHVQGWKTLFFFKKKKKRFLRDSLDDHNLIVESSLE